MFDVQVGLIFNYAKSLMFGEEQNRPKAARIFEGLAYFHPKPQLCLFELAHVLDSNDGGIEMDLEKRFTVLERASALGDDESSYLLGCALLDGRGTGKDVGRAMEILWSLYESSSTLKGDAGLLLSKVILDCRGIGQEGDEELRRAVEILESIRRSQNDAVAVEASLLLGGVLQSGVPDLGDTPRARQVYLDVEECEGKHEVLFRLALMYERGEGD